MWLYSKGTQTLDNSYFFDLNHNLIWSWSIFEKKFDSFFLIFAKTLIFKHSRSDWAYSEPIFFCKLLNFFFNVHFGPFKWVPWRFLKFLLFTVKICILILLFGVIFENYSMRTLSIPGNDFIACWAYAEWISTHAEHTGKWFIAHWSYEETISSHAEHTRNQYNTANCLERRMGDKEQRHKIRNRGRETRNEKSETWNRG
jgi:hypothetical protein